MTAPALPTVTLPADAYYLVHVDEAFLVNDDDDDDLEPMSPLAERVLADIDHELAHEPGHFSTVAFADHLVTFFADPAMGLNHRGLTDGYFIVSEAFLDLIADDPRLDDLTDYESWPLLLTAAATLSARALTEADFDYTGPFPLPLAVNGRPLAVDLDSATLTY